MSKLAIKVWSNGRFFGAITVTPDTLVGELAHSIANMQLAAHVTIVFAGRVLSERDTVHEACIIDGSIVHSVVDDNLAEISVQIGDSSPMTVLISRTDTIWELQSRVASSINVCPDQVTLVHRGHVLSGQLSVSYFGLRKGSFVRAVVHDRDNLKPAQIIDALYKMLSRFISSPSPERDDILCDMSLMIENPALQTYTAFDSEARQLIDDVIMTIENADEGPVSEIDNSLALLGDLTMTQFEQSLEGAIFLEGIFLEDDHRIAPQIPITSYTLRGITDTPLPTWWSRSNVFSHEFRGGHTKDNFRRELRTLKKLGFSDDVLILKALTETCGNIPRAAEMLSKSKATRVTFRPRG